jgi:GNAT superfamily N-acetyltransferase
MRWPGPDGCFASDEPELVDLGQVHAWISGESYWAEGRPRDVMAQAIANSLVIGLYTAEGTQIGFARFVTDYATFAWLCDVFVDSAHRGKRLGTFLAQTAIEHPGVRGARQILATEPGRTLYARFGYGPLARPERWMERPGMVP